jgi:2-C-methyl-D-erythritol 4-phosphate cytidylyltransferase
MPKTIKNIAVILAAGAGERSGFSTPKQLMKLAGRPVIEHSIKTFQENSQIDEIVIVTNKQCREIIDSLVMVGRFDKCKSVIYGGLERHQSSLAAIHATAHYTSDYDVRLLFHDAVRPMLSDKIINDVISALAAFNAVDVVVNATDTIVVADPVTNTISSIPDRSILRSGQTPQGFSHETIARAYEAALADPMFVATDDCGVVLKYLPGEKIYLVSGDSSNIKLTYKEDLHVLDKLCQLRAHKIEIDSTHFALAKLKDKVIVVFGGTSGIGKEIATIASAYQAHVVAIGSRDGIDVASMESVKECLRQARDELGQIDYVVNCAAVLTRQALVDMNFGDINRAIQTNYVGAINVAIAAFDYLRQTKGHLLNFTSSSYTYGRALYSVYSSSKAAVVNLTQALADEWHSSGIYVNCINPERTKTPMRVKAFGAEPDETLLNVAVVAEKALVILVSSYSGQIFDVKNVQ